MRLRPLVSVAAVGLALFLTAPTASPAPAGAGPNQRGREGGRLLVTFRSEAGSRSVRTAHAVAGAQVRRRLDAIATDVVAVDDVAAALHSYRRRPDVEAVEIDGRVRALTPPVDNLYGLQWNLQPAGAGNRGSLNWEPVYPQARGAGVLVAVLDTGISTGGADGFEPLAVRTDIDYDFVDDDNVANDLNGHGTHIAGTIAQRTGNANSPAGWSLAGVAPGAQILPIKVLDGGGEGSVADTVSGILYAAAQGAKVINMSLGGEYSKALCTAVASVSGTALVVAAAGNEGEGGRVPVSYPAACPRAVGVGAVRHDGSRAPYSNTGCELAATAPGGDLGSTRLFRDQQDPRNAILQETYVPTAGGFGLFLESGTSMAAAHAAGAAAVLLGVNPDLEAVRRALLGAARDLGPSGADSEFGSGALDLGNAVNALRGSGRPAPPPDAVGYWTVASDGGIFAFGDSPYLGSTGDIRLNSPIVGMARTPTGLGYWLVAADGGIFAFGDAPFLGSVGNLNLNRPIVAMASTATGRGYWLVASDGGIFAFGDALFMGSMGNIALNRPIVGIATDRLNVGYWLVASDGGIFAFGAAAFLGSTGGMPLNAPIVGMAASPTGQGYWLVASDGGLFTFGDAAFFGSTGDIVLNKPIVGMTSSCYGSGYWLVASDGGLFTFGNAPFRGSAGDIPLNKPVVAMQLAIDQRFGQG